MHNEVWGCAEILPHHLLGEYDYLPWWIKLFLSLDGLVILVKLTTTKCVKLLRADHLFK